MATTNFKSTPVTSVGELPAIGNPAPSYSLTGADLADFEAGQFAGKRTVLNIFPSVDTGICAASLRKFNELAADLKNTTVICVSKDLPFALGRFCGAEGIDNVTVGSAFRSDFGEQYGVTMVDGPMKGLLARSVVILDEKGQVTYTELVPEITQEPNYDAAVDALG